MWEVYQFLPNQSDEFLYCATTLSEIFAREKQEYIELYNEYKDDQDSDGFIAPDELTILPQTKVPQISLYTAQFEQPPDDTNLNVVLINVVQNNVRFALKPQPYQNNSLNL